MVRRALSVGACLILTLGGVVALAGPPAQASAPRLLVYGSHDRGVTVQRAPNVAQRLKGSPASFQDFVRRTLRQLHHDHSCSSGFIGLTVDRVRTDGYARGAVNACGGYVAIWKDVRGHWREVIGTQDIWTCRALRHWTIPSSVVGPNPRCAAGTRVIAYHHA